MKQWASTAPSQPPALGSMRAQGDVSPDRYLGDHEAIGVVTQQTITVLLCGSHFLPRWSGFEGPELSWLQGAWGQPAAWGCWRPDGWVGTRVAQAGISSPSARSVLCSRAGCGTRGKCTRRGCGHRLNAGAMMGTGERLRGHGDEPSAAFA